MAYAPQTPVRRRAAFPPYPSGLLPRGRRRRGHSFGYYVYLGSHPVLTLIGLIITVYVWMFLALWVLAVTAGWLIYGGASVAWQAMRKKPLCYKGLACLALLSLA